METPRKVIWCSFGEQEATTRPSRSCSLMSLIMSCWVPSEQANIVVSAMHDAGLVLERVTDGRDVDVVGDVPAAVADVDADAPLLGHTGTTSEISAWVRCAATCATAAPA